MQDVRIKLPYRVRNVVRMRPNEAMPPLPPRPERAVPPKSPSVEIKPDAALQQQLQKQMAADRESIERTLKELGDGLRQLYDLQQRQVSELQQVAVEIAVSMAGRLMMRELDEERFELETMVRGMVEQLGDEQLVSIRMNAADLQLMQQRLGGKPLFPDREWTPKISPDPTVSRGGCVIEGKLQSLVNDPASDLLKMREEILERMNHARS